MSNPPMPRAIRSLVVIAALAPAVVACTEPPPAPRRGLALTEVAADGDPVDWIEVVNVTSQPLDLVDYVYVDLRNDLERARPFSDITLEPGERHVQAISELRSGFGLAADEEVWIYRASDGALVDGVDWDDGASPAGGSLARLGDTGGFVTVAVATPGAANPRRR